MRLTLLVLSATRLAMTFQWPGGVSELGPSAQNSARTLAKSPRLTRYGMYGEPVAGLLVRPWPSLVASGLFPNDAGEMAIVTPSSGVSWLLRRMTATTLLR